MAEGRATKGEGGPGLGWASILLPLSLGFLVSLILAYQALDAGRSHRAAAEAAAREHAQFAAFLTASSVDRLMQEALLYSFYPIDLALGRDPGGIPPPTSLNAEPEASRCEPDQPGNKRLFFRYDVDAEDLVLNGAPDPIFRRWVLSTLAPTLETAPKGRMVRHAVAELDGRQSLVAYRVWGNEDRRVIYGFESCWRTAEGSVFDVAIAGTQALPPSLVATTPNDSLFSVAVRHGKGAEVYGDGWTALPQNRYRGTAFYGTVPVEPSEAYAGLELRVTLLPTVAERLVEGGLPASRLPLAVGLVVLTGALMWIAIRQLQRGHELVNLRGRFVQNVSHELRTPLQQILLFIDLLRADRLDDDVKKREALDVMHAETHRLIVLVQNILRFSGSKDVELPLSTVDLSSLVEDTVEAFRPLGRTRGAEILISAPVPVAVKSNANALKRILINLLDNAVKYGPDGQTIQVDVRGGEAWGEVSVTDRGPGVPEIDRPKIWESFGRLEREQAGATPGSGIGLSIVRQIAHAVGGEVGVADGVEGGACFTLRLPVPEPRR